MPSTMKSCALTCTTGAQLCFTGGRSSRVTRCSFVVIDGPWSIAVKNRSRSSACSAQLGPLLLHPISITSARSRIAGMVPWISMRDRAADRPLERIDLRSQLPVIALLLVAAALRLPGIASRALWIDEAFCVRLAQLDWSQLAERAAADNHPPLYFAVLKLWMTVFGSSALALRSLDVV